ncbi:aldolase [Coniophora puteana RWD-64-598 SS2]|uniref:fructose-bisphosphate aldolase n=1 Tax=Coniophora puteana (strain RWD-64-598) TaxID=741705 RepID=A0A5M3MPK8_CONPW|nr:aldolase [Coniophora puteana RWD-64-598 SS2]EIW80996.1 aldolase [Coniophora puteana RWD-64-598 SS2]
MSLNATSTPGYTFGTGAAAGAVDSDPNAYLYPHHTTANAKALIETAQALVNPRGKGIYATDETPEGIEARLIAALGADAAGKTFSDAEKRDRRRRWRECLYESLPTDYISGVILYYETLVDFQLAPVLAARGIIPGVRADTDAHPLPISPAEPATQGLDDLLPRLQAARAAGARFTKWRAPILCNSSSLPSHAALEVQAESLARFAAISQQAGLVPIVEPDVDFSDDADLKRSVEVHVKIINLIYARCAAYGVLLEGSLIKPSFAQPGLKHPSRSTVSAEEIGLATATVLARSVPIAVAGVVFLSGGLSDGDAIKYLNAVNKVIDTPPAAGSHLRLSHLPPLTFSFGRGLQGDAMQKWVKGDEAGAKQAFEVRAKACSTAARGGA